MKGVVRIIRVGKEKVQLRKLLARAGVAPQTFYKRIARGMPEAKAATTPDMRQKTHCVAGHRLSPSNVYVRPDGFKQCRPCMRRRWREMRARRKAASR